MSEQGLAALLERLTSDPAFQEQIEAAPTKDAKRQIIQEAGFDVGPSDLPAVRSMLGARELSDEDLEMVAGGVGGPNSADCPPANTSGACGAGISAAAGAIAAAALLI